MTLTLVVLGASREECAQSPIVATMADELVLVANPGARWGGLGAIGNHYLETALGEALGLIHADTMLSPAVIDSLLRAAAGGVAGVVGSAATGTIWSDNIAAPHPVCTLDSCAMFVSRALARAHQLRFDLETFDAFHCCVEDFCLQAAAAGLPVVVAPGLAGHPLAMVKLHYGDTEPLATSSAGPTIGRRWRPGEHELYKGRLVQKWAQRGVRAIYTT